MSGAWVGRIFRSVEVMLVALIVWATITEGPSVFGTVYVLACAAIVEGSYRVVRWSWEADQ